MHFYLSAIKPVMGIIVYFFDSPKDLGSYVEQQLKEARGLILSHSHRLEEARKKFDSRTKGGTKSRQSEVAGFRVLVNPTADYELQILDEAVKSTQEKIEVLERVRKELIPSLKETRVTAILDDGIPTAFMCDY
jgi:hypothetical protein